MSSKKPSVAVLLAAYNGVAWIGKQLESIQRQAAVDVTVFISVDPSSDGTEAWCVEYEKAYRNVTVLPSAGRFGGAARNFLRLLRDVDFLPFDYVAFSDQDDIWYSNKLSRAISQVRSAGCDAYSSNVIAFWPDGRRMMLDKAQPQAQWDYLFEAAGPGCTYVLSRVLAQAFKQSLIDQWERAQDVSLHDWYCYAFARSHGYRWCIDSQPGMDYRQHSSNEVGANVGLKTVYKRLGRIWDGWWFSQIRLISSLVAQTATSPVNDVAMLGRVAMIRLALMAKCCRRRGRDQLAFAVICLVEALRGRD